MRLGILGGSFDPVHRGHRQMARFVLETDLVDQVMVIPANLSPFKDRTVASAENRLAMTRLAFADCDRCLVDDMDLQRPGPSYMVDTLALLRERRPADTLHLIIGADNLAGLPRWHRAEEILEQARVLVLGRDGLENHQLENRQLEVRQLEDRFRFLPEFDERVSSREIRAMLAAGEVPADKLDPAVIRYIAAHALYH